MPNKNYFTREEMACKCGCEQDTIDGELLDVLNRIRRWAKKPVTVTSGNRCFNYNIRIGGSRNSQHVKSRAADIQVEGKTPEQVADYIQKWYPDSLGLGRYETFTHVDTRKHKARW